MGVNEGLDTAPSRHAGLLTLHWLLNTLTYSQCHVFPSLLDRLFQLSLVYLFCTGIVIKILKERVENVI